MSRPLAVGLLWLGVFLVAESATAVVYIPGQYQDGIYVRPHFRESAEHSSKQDWLQRLQESSARTGEADDERAPAKAAPIPLEKPE